MEVEVLEALEVSVRFDVIGMECWNSNLYKKLQKPSFYSPDLCGWSFQENRAPSQWTTSTWLVTNTLHSCVNSLYILELLHFFYLSEVSYILFYVGGALLACPVTEAGVQQVAVLLPGSTEVNEPPGNTFIYVITNSCYSWLWMLFKYFFLF